MADIKVILLVVAIFFGMVLSDNLPSERDYQEIIMDCHKMYPVEANEIQDLVNSVHRKDADRLQKCFLKCFLEKTDMMDADGNFNVQRIYDISYARHEDEMKQDPMKGIEECIKANSDETNPCLKAFEATKCVADKKLWEKRNEL